MHPILFSVGSHAFYSYGFFMTVGYLAGVVLFLILAHRDGLSAWTGVDLILWLLPPALIGAKLLSILTNWSDFLRHPSLIASGWSFQGALLGVLIAALILFRKRGLDPWRWLDTAAPVMALTGAVGRIGCLMAGCCWGAPTDLPWGVVFTESKAAPLNIPLHPTQAYYLIASLFIFMALLLRRKSAVFRGELILLFVLMYLTSRSIIDPFRALPARGWFLGTVTTYQITTIAQIVVVAILYYWVRGRNRIERAAG